MNAEQTTLITIRLSGGGGVVLQVLDGGLGITVHADEAPQPPEATTVLMLTKEAALISAIIEAAR